MSTEPSGDGRVSHDREIRLNLIIKRMNKNTAPKTESITFKVLGIKFQSKHLINTRSSNGPQEKEKSGLFFC